jgi:FAD/FMN-containing dehydrogenase
MFLSSSLPLGIESLRDQLDGVVVLPGEDGWDAARMAWNVAVDQRPAMVVIPRSAADIRVTVDHAREHGLRIAMQGTGHNAAPMGDLAGTVLVKTHEMRGVEIDAETQVARAEAGALWIDVTAPASELGLAALSGSSPDVGVVGYTLGGGLSIGLGRRYGLAAERVLAIELVTADGELVRATRSEHADLFWALRGGGGSFGAVTAIEFELIALPTVYAGMLLWPVERVREVLHAWREWTATAPDSITTSARVLHLPDMPELPDFLRGRSVVVIDGGCAESEDRAAEILAPLRALSPEIDTFMPVPPVALSHIHMDPEDPMPSASGSGMLDELSASALDELIDFALTPGSPLMMHELRHLGGALARPGTGALGAFTGAYLAFAGGLAIPPLAAALEAALEGYRDLLARHGSGREYSNFAERATDPARFFGDERVARLRAVKTAVDPHDLFRGNHEIRPA